MTDSAALTAAAPSARLTANMLSNSGAAAAAIAEQQEDQPLASEHTHCLNQGSASASVGHVPVTVAFKVTPINPSSGQALALPQLLTGDAAMALHALLIQLHVKKMRQLAPKEPRQQVEAQVPLQPGAAQKQQQQQSSSYPHRAVAENGLVVNQEQLCEPSPAPPASPATAAGQAAGATPAPQQAAATQHCSTEANVAPSQSETATALVAPSGQLAQQVLKLVPLELLAQGPAALLQQLQEYVCLQQKLSGLQDSPAMATNAPTAVQADDDMPDVATRRGSQRLSVSASLLQSKQEQQPQQLAEGMAAAPAATTPEAVAAAAGDGKSAAAGAVDDEDDDVDQGGDDVAEDADVTYLPRINAVDLVRATGMATSAADADFAPPGLRATLRQRLLVTKRQADQGLPPDGSGISSASCTDHSDTQGPPKPGSELAPSLPTLNCSHGATHLLQQQHQKWLPLPSSSAAAAAAATVAQPAVGRLAAGHKLYLGMGSSSKLPSVLGSRPHSVAGAGAADDLPGSLVPRSSAARGEAAAGAVTASETLAREARFSECSGCGNEPVAQDAHTAAAKPTVVLFRPTATPPAAAAAVAAAAAAWAAHAFKSPEAQAAAAAAAMSSISNLLSQQQDGDASVEVRKPYQKLQNQQASTQLDILKVQQAPAKPVTVAGAAGAVAASGGIGTAAKAANNSSSSQRFRGVRLRPWGKWATEIRDSRNGTRVWLGTFDDPEEAAKVYDAAARELRGPKCPMNFPMLPAAEMLRYQAIAREVMQRSLTQPPGRGCGPKQQQQQQRRRSHVSDDGERPPMDCQQGFGQDEDMDDEQDDQDDQQQQQLMMMMMNCSSGRRLPAVTGTETAAASAADAEGQVRDLDDVAAAAASLRSLAASAAPVAPQKRNSPAADAAAGDPWERYKQQAQQLEAELQQLTGTLLTGTSSSGLPAGGKHLEGVVSSCPGAPGAMTAARGTDGVMAGSGSGATAGKRSWAGMEQTAATTTHLTAAAAAKDAGLLQDPELCAALPMMGSSKRRCLECQESVIE